MEFTPIKRLAFRRRSTERMSASRYRLHLGGRDSVVLTEGEDGSANYGKALLLATVANGKAFDAYVNLITALATVNTERFLAFADSRKMVEQLVSAAGRDLATGEAQQVRWN